MIKRFSDGSFLEYARGSFDNWCVYFTDSTGKRRPPKDVEYFEKLKDLSKTYGVQKVYRDYVIVYNLTSNELSEAALSMISLIAASYGEAELEADIVLSILYLAMIAEERREHTRLGKRIKRLGVHKLLVEGRPVPEAANFMRGMCWRDIAHLCEDRGF